MNGVSSLRVLSRLAGHTFRQTMTSGASWMMAAGSAACVAGCLAIPFHGPADVYAAEQMLSAWAVQGAGLLLALVLTAGILPAYLAPHAASVLLTKPTPRWLLLAGKYLGVVAFVAVHAAILVGGLWMALGARAGVWDARFLLGAPLFVLHFAVFFSFSAMLASATRNTAVCIFGTVLFWLLCWAMNFGRCAAVGLMNPHTLSPAFAWTVDAVYWVMPKPLDFQLALTDGAHGGPLAQISGLDRLTERGAWAPGFSLLASGLSGAALLATAAYDFGKAEY